MTRRALGANIFFCLLVIIGFFARGEARTVKVAIPGYSEMIAYTISKEKGYYRDEGLDVEFILMAAGVAVRAIIAGDVDFGSLAPATFPSVLRGAPLRAVFSPFYRPMFWLYSRPDIRDIRELKGKKVGVHSIGTGIYMMLLDILQRQGLEGGRDVTLIAMGVNSTLYGAMVSGNLDATMIAIPHNFMLQEARFHELVSFLKEDFPHLGGSISTREALLKSDPITVEKFIRGSLKGHLYARENRSGTIPILARLLKVKEDLAAKIYDVNRPAMTEDGTVNEAAQRNALDPALKLVGMKEPPPLDKVYDFSQVRKARAELETSGWRPRP